MTRRSRNQPKTVSPVLDVVVTTAGRFDMLTKCLDALYREAQSVPITVSIVDIASNAEERIQNQSLFEYQEDKDPSGYVMDFQSKRLVENVGFPQGANEGARMGRANLIMFLNDDVELHEGALKKVVDTFVDETVGIVGIKLLFPPDSTNAQRPAGKVQHAGLSLNIRGEPIHTLVGWSPDNKKTQISRDAWAVTGACFSIHRALFNKAGGFNVIYGRGTHEDCDLCLTVRKMGKRVYLNSNASAYHYVGASAEKRGEGFPIMQNRMLFQSRWSQSGLLEWEEWKWW